MPCLGIGYNVNAEAVDLTAYRLNPYARLIAGSVNSAELFFSFEVRPYIPASLPSN